MLELDHLAVACTDLAAGQAAVEKALGVPMAPGGRHAHFATHNVLLGLGPGCYLEVIAIDPEAPTPGYPRWFDLDRFSGPPRLHNWICRTQSLEDAVARLPEAGQPVRLARGDLRWRMAVPGDGRLPFDNRFPALIEWEAGDHPAARLPETGCRLTRLVVCHPRAPELEARLTPGLRDPRVVFQTGAPALRAEIATPRGARVLA
jgi:hypothetical protein